MTYIETIECDAPTIIFTEPIYENIPLAYREVIEQQRGLPCDAGGVPGPWCRRCFWAGILSDNE